VIRLAVRVRRAEAELALAELLELSPAGVEEAELDAERVEFAIYGAPGELPELPDLRAAVGDALVEVSSRPVADDWSQRWRQFHRAVTVAGRLHVRPSWEPPPERGLVDVVIDPGQAFGTGGHATTRLCLELLAGLPAGGPLLDLGCGSGVLAIAAAKLGWGPVSGVDNEREAVRATRANAAANGVTVHASRLDLLREPPPAMPVVVGNLLRQLLLRLARALIEPPKVLIAGGLLATEADEIAAAFAARGLAERRRLGDGEWAALELRTP
jgi:ribosomal protein L11 methyltransferase